MKRCEWVGKDSIYVDYHDNEWGVPVRDDRKLFEMLLLEGAQAGLSWITILKKRENYRRLFDRFDPHKIARYDQSKLDALRQNPGIVRNRLKVQAAVQNALAYLELMEAGESFSEFMWQFVGGEPVVNAWDSLQQVPATTDASDAMSKALKRHGFKFVGSTICYAFMQAVGMVNDHAHGCFRRAQIIEKYQRLPQSSFDA